MTGSVELACSPRSSLGSAFDRPRAQAQEPTTHSAALRSTRRVSCRSAIARVIATSFITVSEEERTRRSGMSSSTAKVNRPISVFASGQVSRRSALTR